MPEHNNIVTICPYAAPLSDDEDASCSNPDHPTAAAGTGTNKAVFSPTSEALTAARTKCPAFAKANGGCPFRDTVSNPDSLMEVMKTVPPSHFPSSSSALRMVVANSKSSSGGGEGGINSSGGGGGSGNAATQFQLAMEHVHQVSSWLEQSGSDSSQVHSESTTSKNDNESSPTNNATTTTGRKRSSSISSMTQNDRDSFIIRGGCPFKVYHKEHHNHNTSKRLARAMEDFSLAAIMGRMAEESFDDDDGELVEEEEGQGQGSSEEEDDGKEVLQQQQQQEEGDIDNEDSNMPKDQAVSSSTDNDNPQQDDDSSSPPTQQQTRTSGLLSQALKTGTAKSHTAAENVHFVNNFIKGIIDRSLYMEMVTGLYHTYITLEQLLEQHAPKEFPTLHFPKELSRTTALREDMEYWHGLNWESKPECIKPSPAVQDYIDRMIEVGRLDPLLLLSHAYTRYLGDLSGGKVLSRIARRALNLSRGYDGLQFYQFDHIKSAKLFKDKYRMALDQLVLRSDQIGKLVAEANVAFALNMRVFEELDVRGGVEGARVRNVREALSYYDIEMEEQEKRRSSGSGSTFLVNEGGGVVEEEEAKCPFGYKGPNPHGSLVSGKETKQEFDTKGLNNSTTSSPLSEAVQSKEHASGEGGRCPWPFVFFHDPMMGMKDWQT
ncbi:hypothetical protein ACHAXR_002656, partial [Thalassiosira sp. AJA248-18]